MPPCLACFQMHGLAKVTGRNTRTPAPSAARLAHSAAWERPDTGLSRRFIGPAPGESDAGSISVPFLASETIRPSKEGRAEGGSGLGGPFAATVPLRQSIGGDEVVAGRGFHEVVAPALITTICRPPVS